MVDEIEEKKEGGDYSTIAKTSETILEMLRDEITERSDVVNVERNEIALVSPTQVGADSDVRLSLYLYGLREFRPMSNATDPGIKPDPIRGAPLALNLQYLLTAYPSTGGNDETANTIDQQRVLGLAMQVLHHNSVIGPDELDDSLGNNELAISLEMQDIDRIEDIYHSLKDATLHPSVTYHVGPVLIASREEMPAERTGEFRMSYNRGQGQEQGQGSGGD